MGSRRKAPRRKAEEHSFKGRTYLLVLKVVRYPTGIQLLNVVFRYVILTIDVLFLDMAVPNLLLQMYTFLYLEDIGP